MTPETLFRLGEFTQEPEETTLFKDTLKFLCEFCGDAFSSNKGMRQHIGKIHLTKNRTVRCPLCSKQFKHKYALKFHTLQVHELATRVQCGHCSKTLYNKYSLKKHAALCKKY